MKQCSARAKAALGLLLLLPLLFIGTASVQAATPDATDAEPAADQATTAEPTAEPSADKVELSATDAAILGLVEGLTEYLPVSSTGHLLVTNKVLGLGGTEASDAALKTYAICIQSGAILAVLLLYKKRIWQMVDGLLGRSDEGRRVLIAVVAAFVPTAIIAQFVFPIIRDRFFGVGPIAGAWIVGGFAILAMTRAGFLDRAGHELATITVRQATMIGLLQTVAIWPGVSRSLVTIVAGVLVGMNLRASVEFSFLLGLVTLSAATVYEGLKGGSELVDTFGVASPLIGLAVAFVSALIAVKWMVDWLQRRGFEVFGWYRLGAGVLAFIALSAGWL